MGKPDCWSRNEKSNSTSLARRLSARYAIRPTTAASTATWNATRSTRTSRHSGGRDLVAVAIKSGVYTRSAVRRGVEKAPLLPLGVDAPLEVERAHRAVVDLAVVAHLRDHV